MTSRNRSAQRGAATVLVLPLLAALTIAAVLLALVGGGVATRRRVEAAADLAALAGASALQRGGEGCPEAAVIVARNAARLVSCRVVDAQVEVTVGADTPALFGRSLTVTARARAGPEPG